VRGNFFAERTGLPGREIEVAQEISVQGTESHCPVHFVQGKLGAATVSIIFGTMFWKK
jgi:hypothetical protein